jgi:hypothetical protein
MILATILLTIDDEYLCDGDLPDRPQFDKKLLASIIKGETVSHEGYRMLPPSLQELVSITHGEPTAPITVPEINGLADILIVSRSRSRCHNGKKFRFDNFERILEQGQIEIWRRK